ncbi:MAG: class I SAM-dependent methyltransferase [Thermoplasmata archaeon]|nr:class I SAM-dependent methyltransferase [Thermoplasmata archaeon]
MPSPDPEKVKDAVRRNFDVSVEAYDAFEAEHGLFAGLTRHLAGVASVGKGMRVCDVGCGSGASTVVLSEVVGPGGRVIGIDISETMLRAAEARPAPYSNCCYLAADAADVCDIEGGLDAVLFNASIFLIPDPAAVLAAARDALAPGGVVAMNFLDGLRRTRDGIDPFEEARREGAEHAPYGRRIMDPSTLPGILEELGFRDITEGHHEVPMTRDQAFGFYSIPAQSAGLWPRTPHEERVAMLERVLSPGSDAAFVQGWGWVGATK